MADADTITTRLTDMEERGMRENDAYNKLNEERDALFRQASDKRRAYDQYNDALLDYKSNGGSVDVMTGIGKNMPDVNAPEPDATATKAPEPEPTPTEKVTPETAKIADEETAQQSTEASKEPTAQETEIANTTKELDRGKQKLADIEQKLQNNRNAKRRITEGASRANRKLNAEETEQIKALKAERNT